MTMDDVRELLALFFAEVDNLTPESAQARAEGEVKSRGGGGWRVIGGALVHCSNPAAPFSPHTHWAFYPLPTTAEAP